ncbi:MAG: tRNA uridine-5-carboxymethylaminomethyl(34) synthesis GTPase MnmE [Acutalibacteraceae bacterium]
MSTIAAVSTPYGQGGISVIRISGPDAFKISDSIFKSANNKKICDIKGYEALFGYVYADAEKKELLDECVALKFIAPKSYTGENIVELSVHGGMFVTEMVLRSVFSAGAVPAEAGEFTKRAFLNGKIDLTEAESVMDIISANSKASAKSAIAIKEGRLFKEIQNIKENLLDKAAHLGAWADYPEEDIPQVEKGELLASFDKSIEELSALIKSYDVGKVLKNGIDTVIAGKPNVGKSTLMNMLSGVDKSIVTSVPGTTRDVVEETVAIGNITLNLSDTAGIRKTEDEIEKIGVDKSKNKLKKAGLVLAVFDGSRELSDEDREIVKEISDTPSIAVINKEDLERKINIEYIKANFKHIVYISALNNKGKEDLEKEIAKIAGTDNINDGDIILQNERQRNTISKALMCLKEAKKTLLSGITMDAVSVDLEECIDNLLTLTGERASIAVVDKVFHNFCVGK